MNDHLLPKDKLLCSEVKILSKVVYLKGIMKYYTTIQSDINEALDNINNDIESVVTSIDNAKGANKDMLERELDKLKILVADLYDVSYKIFRVKESYKTYKDE